MKSIMLACDQLLLNAAESILAGGMESMSNAPFFLPKARSGYRMGHGEVLDHMMRDGLEDAYPSDPKGPRSSMGIFAEATAEKYGFSRADQDSFAIQSVEKYKKALESKYFDTEILPIKISDDNFVSVDEPPSKVKIDKIPQLKPAFKKDGTVTAASSSSIADGAAVVHIVSEAYLKKHSLKPLARIVGYTSHSQEPAWFTTAPVGAIQKLLKQTGWAIKDVDLFELNEAFAVVTMAATKDLGIDPSKVNIHGGACALGHPIGASGARILVTLLHALHTHKLNKGIASLCIGGGEAVSMAIERV
jgi:acetyl-CoA C-acetyltransferase